jgi:hypothetical protein
MLHNFSTREVVYLNFSIQQTFRRRNLVYLLGAHIIDQDVQSSELHGMDIFTHRNNARIVKVIHKRLCKKHEFLLKKAFIPPPSPAQI